jgi:hypothetical protein
VQVVVTEVLSGSVVVRFEVQPPTGKSGVDRKIAAKMVADFKAGRVRKKRENDDASAYFGPGYSLAE